MLTTDKFRFYWFKSPYILGSPNMNEHHIRDRKAIKHAKKYELKLFDKISFTSKHEL